MLLLGSLELLHTGLSLSLKLFGLALPLAPVILVLGYEAEVGVERIEYYHLTSLPHLLGWLDLWGRAGLPWQLTRRGFG